MMLTTEKVFDMLPMVVDIYEKLELDIYRKKIAEENKGKAVDKNQVGIDAFKYIIKNIGKVKEEVFQIVAAFEEKTIEEIKNQSFTDTINSFKEIFSNKEAMHFFKQAVQ
jgi:archaellum component FlaC